MIKNKEKNISHELFFYYYAKICNYYTLKEMDEMLDYIPNVFIGQNNTLYLDCSTKTKRQCHNCVTIGNDPSDLQDNYYSNDREKKFIVTFLIRNNILIVNLHCNECIDHVKKTNRMGIFWYDNKQKRFVYDNIDFCYEKYKKSLFCGKIKKMLDDKFNNIDREVVISKLYKK